MNEYLVRAIKRIIVPSGLKEVVIRVGEVVVTVRADGTNSVTSPN
jgi:hypothetical protein